MKNVFLQAMNEVFNLSSMLDRIDYHHIRGALTDEEREELIAHAREKATPLGGLDVAEKLKELDERISALEEASSGGEGAGDANNPEEYIAGKWYYRGDRVTYKGKTYECDAPEGVACVWSPDEYPAYWDAI